MFFLKKLKRLTFYRVRLKKKKKGYIKKRLKKLVRLSNYLKKKKIFKIRKMNFFLNRKKYLNLDLFNFLNKYLIFNNKTYSSFFKNNFFFFNITKRKNNVFFNVTDFEKNMIYSNSLKRSKKIKKKRDLFKKKIISYFLINCLKVFFKDFILTKIFNLLPNTYILSDKEQTNLISRIIRILIKFAFFFVNLYITPKYNNKAFKYLYSIKKNIKYLKRRKRIKIIALKIRYKSSFNGCKLKKLKRL